MTTSTPQHRANPVRGRTFRLLWSADILAQHSTAALTAILPLLAATTLAATPAQMGVLTATEMVAFLLLGLPAGAWADRVRRRPVIITAELARAMLVLTMPVAIWLDQLTFTHLVLAGVAISAAAVFSDVAYHAYLPSILGEANLLTGYSRVQATRSAAEAAGPVLGGLLLHLAGPATALAATATGFLGASGLTARVRPAEPRPPRPDAPQPLRTDITDGLRFLLRHRQLRLLTAASTNAAFFTAAILAVEILVFIRDLGLDATGTGLLLALSGAGGVAGAASTTWWVRRLGTHRALWLVPAITWPAHAGFPLAQPGPSITAAAGGITVFAYGAGVVNTPSASLRQKLAPDDLRGRVTATMRVIIWGIMPLGSLAAGALAELTSPRTTLWVAIVGTLMSIPIMGLPALRTVIASTAGRDATAR